MKIELEIKTGTEAFLMMEVMKKHLDVESCKVIARQLEKHLNQLWSGQITQEVVNEVLEDSLIERIAQKSNQHLAGLKGPKYDYFNPDQEAARALSSIKHPCDGLVDEALEVEKNIKGFDLSKIEPSVADTLPRAPDFWQTVDKGYAEFYAAKAMTPEVLKEIRNLGPFAAASFSNNNSGEENVSTK